MGAALAATYLTSVVQFFNVAMRLRHTYRSGPRRLEFGTWMRVALPIFLIEGFGFLLTNSDVVVVGRGVTVGRPLGLLLTRRSENATVTLCHTGTVDLAAHVRQADIVVAAAGVPGIITGDMVKAGAAVLDVGVSRVDMALPG